MVPLDKLEIDALYFREQLSEYSEEEIENYLEACAKSMSMNKNVLKSTDIGYILTCLIEKKGKYEMDGNDLHCLGHGLKSGKLYINNSAGDDVGWGMENATIIVEKNAGDYLGRHLNSGRIIVNGNAGKKAGLQMKNGIIICLGKIKKVSKWMEGGMIYAGEFGEVPENVKKFTSDLYPVAFDVYNEFPELKRYVLKKIQKCPEKFYTSANNREKQELLAEMMDKNWREIAVEHERTRSGMW